MFLPTSFLVVASSSLTMARSIGRRASNENVVLADCTGGQDSNDLASEVAYFSGTPNDTPDDIATVTTGQYHDWANTTTEAYFSDTGVIFKSVLIQNVTAGDYAGTGTNGYANFTCWQMDPTFLYTNENRNCFVMYDCNHLSHAASLPSATPSASSTPSSSASASSTSTSNSQLSVGAIVGLSIGVAVGAILLAGIAGFFLWRHWRSTKRNPPVAVVQETQFEKGLPDVPKGPSPVNPIWQGPGAREVQAPIQTPQVYHELHSDERPTEIFGDALRGELDATPSRVELHSQDLPPRYEHERVSPGAYGNFKGPV
ncbi:hypothetical protein F5Y06DRAFT_275357 [Hypoxylon sp. FL0890]|nr:hypothetical protein F5Y06DRAFT_275357 [Hypoxylon sp. FL0890]